MSMGQGHPRYEAEQRREQEPEAAFLDRFLVREFHNSDHNVARLLRSAGARAPAVWDVLLRLCPTRGSEAISGPFDHGRLFGRDRVPLLLVGHPYDLLAEDEE